LRDYAAAASEINAVYPSARHVSAKVKAFTEFLKAEFEKIPALRVR
jgi:DNA-binding transcriptional LysR family regulator